MKKLLVFLFVSLAINASAYAGDKKAHEYAQESEGADFNTKDLHENGAGGTDETNKQADPPHSKQHAKALHHNRSHSKGHKPRGHAHVQK